MDDSDAVQPRFFAQRLLDAAAVLVRRRKQCDGADVVLRRVGDDARDFVFELEAQQISAVAADGAVGREADHRNVFAACGVGGADDAFTQHRADNDVGAVRHQRARRGVGGGFVRAGVAGDQQRVLVAVVEQRQLGGVVERVGFLRAQREGQQ